MPEIISRKEARARAAARWRKNNPDKSKVVGAQWRTRNRERAKAATARWAKNNPDKAKASQANWAAKNRDKIKERMARWRTENAEKVKEYKRKNGKEAWRRYVERHPEKFKGKTNRQANCVQCTKKFIYVVNGNAGVYCSKDCSIAFRIKKAREKVMHRRGLTDCLNCGKKFLAVHGNQKLCSEECNLERSQRRRVWWYQKNRKIFLKKLRENPKLRAYRKKYYLNGSKNPKDEMQWLRKSRIMLRNLRRVIKRPNLDHSLWLNEDQKH